MMNKNLVKKLMASCIKVDDSTVEVFPNNGNEHANIDTAGILNEIENFEFDLVDDVVAFKFRDSLFSAWRSSSLFSIMQAMGFHRNPDAFYVPFANGSYPEGQFRQWYALKMQAEAERHQDLVNECIEYATENLIGSVEEYILDECFEIPENGMSVKDGDKDRHYFPQVTASEDLDRVGKYNISNGILMFNYRDGRTFLTKSWNILNLLKHLGYERDRGLSVPLSRGEVIMKPEIAFKWKRVEAC